MTILAQVPIPKDIPLELPIPETYLKVVLVVSFLLHILFVNLMVGGSILTLWAEIKGRVNKEFDTLAFEIAKTITVNKSLAVVLGVAPLLTINLVYTVHFYSANALTGMMWIAIVPLVSIAFLLTYLHKYTWKYMERFKTFHIGIIASAVGLFLFIPLIFLVNINLMLFPEKWGTVAGFFSALALPNVFPRYFHFLCASLAITGLFLIWYNKRKAYPFEEIYSDLKRDEVYKIGYSLAFGVSFLQFIIGPIVLFTLPSKGLQLNLFLTIGTGVVFALPAMYYMWLSLVATDQKRNIHFNKIVGFFILTILFMGSGRHIYRENALKEHKELMTLKTEEFLIRSNEAQAKGIIVEELAIDESLGELARGVALFNNYCAACHKERETLVGPSIAEMTSVYGNDTKGLVAWIKAPGKKRANMIQMPGFPQLSEDELQEITKYILSIK